MADTDVSNREPRTLARDSRAEVHNGAGGLPQLPASSLRHVMFGFFVLASSLFCWSSVCQLIHAGLKLEFCSQILVVPLITVFLLYARRKAIFDHAQTTYESGSIAVAVAVTSYCFVRHYAATLGSYDALSLAAIAIILIWCSGFYATYGITTMRAAAFPLGFLILMVPIPGFLLNPTISYLQWGTTLIARHILQYCGVPVLQKGFVLALPGLTVEVAKECSSIRSSIALLITCLLAGYLFLRPGLKRTALVLLALPVSIIKNGVRIVTLSLLSIYVNPAFMTSDLHRDGGIVFYLLALLILYPAFRWFETLDRRAEVAQSST